MSTSQVVVKFIVEDKEMQENAGEDWTKDNRQTHVSKDQSITYYGILDYSI